MNFIDRGAQIGGYTVSFHAWIKNATGPGVECGSPEPYGAYLADYRPQPKKITGDGGTIDLYFLDGGQPGPSNDDLLCVSLYLGAFAGYYSCSTLEAGNITVKVTS